MVDEADELPGVWTIQQVKEIMEKNFPESALSQYMYNVHVLEAEMGLTKRQITHMQSHCTCRSCGRLFDTCSRCSQQHMEEWR